MEIEKVRKAVEAIVKESMLSPIETISLLQKAAAETKNSELLEILCELKWEYIPA